MVYHILSYYYFFSPPSLSVAGREGWKRRGPMSVSRNVDHETQQFPPVPHITWYENVAPHERGMKTQICTSVSGSFPSATAISCVGCVDTSPPVVERVPERGLQLLFYIWPVSCSSMSASPERPARGLTLGRSGFIISYFSGQGILSTLTNSPKHLSPNWW